MKLQLAEKRHSQLLEKKLVVSDELFNDNYQSVVNRDQRSTLFGITTKNALFEKLHHERPRQSSTVKENFKLSGIQEEDEPLEPESPNLMKQNILSVTLNDQVKNRIDYGNNSYRETTQAVGTENQFFESKQSSPSNGNNSRQGKSSGDSNNHKSENSGDPKKSLQIQEEPILDK